MYGGDHVLEALNEMGFKATRCPHCGRLMKEEPTSESTPHEYRRFCEINFDRKGLFYYISNRSHSPWICRYRSTPTGRTIKRRDRT